MKKIVINKSYDKFSVSHQAFLRLRELGQQDVLTETDLGAYWPDAATPNEPSLNQCGRLIPRDDLKFGSSRGGTRWGCQWPWRRVAGGHYPGRCSMDH